MVRLQDIIMTETITELNPVTSVMQALYTKKIIKSLAPAEKVRLGQVVRNAEFIKLAKQFHQNRNSRQRARLSKQMLHHIEDIVDDPAIVQKIHHVTSDPKFDVGRNRVASKLLIPKKTLPYTPQQSNLTQAGQARRRAERSASDKKKAESEFKTWLQTAKIKSPNSGREITIRYVLSKGSDHPAFTAAQSEIQSRRKTMGLAPARMSSLTKPKKASPSPEALARARQALTQEPNPKSFSLPSQDTNPLNKRRKSAFGGDSGKKPRSGFKFGGGGGFSGGGGGSSF
jgi:uncharacterized membrane protein YgcG